VKLAHKASAQHQQRRKTLGVTLAAGLVALLIYLKWDNETGKQFQSFFFY
jgi:hypothetical protein